MEIFIQRTRRFKEQRTWPYEKSKLNIESAYEAYIEASIIPFSIKSIETCLNNQMVILLFQMFISFSYCCFCVLHWNNPYL
jgi:hypothetical protein